MVQLLERFTGTLAVVLLLLGLVSGCDELPLYAPSGSTMVVTSVDPVIEADGESTTEIAARIIPKQGIVADGTEVTFSTTLGTLSQDLDHTVGGVVQTVLRASPVEGTALIWARSGSASDSVSVQIGYSVETLTVLAQPAVHELAAGESKLISSEIIAVVTDRNDNRIARKVVTFAAEEGEISSGSTVVTDEFGEARATFEIHVNESELVGDKVVFINATAGGVQGAVSVQIKPK